MSAVSELQVKAEKDRLEEAKVIAQDEKGLYVRVRRETSIVNPYKIFAKKTRWVKDFLKVMRNDWFRERLEFSHLRRSRFHFN